MGRPKIPWRALITSYVTWGGTENNKPEFHILAAMETKERGRQLVAVIDDTATAKAIARALFMWVAERNDYSADYTDIVQLVMDYREPTDLSNVRYLPER